MVFVAKTQQATALRVLVESLRELLTEANFHLASDGIRLTAMDASQVTLIFTHLYASEFISYECPSEHVIGINLPALHRIIKNVNNHDVLTFVYDPEVPDDLLVRVENPEKDFSMDCNLRLMEIDETMLEVPEKQIECVVTLPSNDLQRYVRDLYHTAYTEK